MSVELVTLIMFGALIVLLALGVPLAFALGGLAVVMGFILMGDPVFLWSVQRIWSLMRLFSFIAIPLFVFMANMMRCSGIADDLYEAIYLWMGSLRGGLAVATVLACTILAAMIGTAGAGVVIMGLIALPFMLRHKYDKGLALGSIIAGGSLGVLIPPSILFILYGLFAEESVGKLFMGGVFPGLILAGLFSFYIIIRSWLQPELAPVLAKEERMVPWRQKFGALTSLILPIFLIIAVMGSIFAGIATPSEAAGVGAMGAVLSAAVRRRLNWTNLKEAVYATIKTVAMLMWIAFAAYVFVGVYLFAGGGEFIKETILGLGLGPWGILIAIQLLLIVMGMFLDWVGILFLVVPMVLPILVDLGFNILWFGVLFNLNMQISYLSPPFGYSLFYLKGVSPPEISMTDIYRSAFPFMALQLIGLALVMLFPQIALWLPSVMIK